MLHKTPAPFTHRRIRALKVPCRSAVGLPAAQASTIRARKPSAAGIEGERANEDSWVCSASLKISSAFGRPHSHRGISSSKDTRIGCNTYVTY
jgi:hypothetical protein